MGNETVSSHEARLWDDRERRVQTARADDTPTGSCDRDVTQGEKGVFASSRLWITVEKRGRREEAARARFDGYFPQVYNRL